MNRKILVVVAAFALALVAAVNTSHVRVAHSEPVYSPFSSVQYTVPTISVGVYNATDSLIIDGTVVMTDTTATSARGVRRFAVKPWDGTALNRHRILGLAWHNIARSSRGGAGSVLITGYHASAVIGATGLSANTPLKTMAGVEGALTAATDTLGLRCGTFYGYNSNATATFPRTGKVMITRQLSVMATVLP